MVPFDKRAHMSYYQRSIVTMSIFCTVFIYIETLVDNLYLAPPLRVTPLEFRRNIWHQQTTVHGLSYDVVCVILRLAVLVQTNRRSGGHMTTAYTTPA